MKEPGGTYKAIGDLFYKLHIWFIAEYFYREARARGARLEWKPK